MRFIGWGVDQETLPASACPKPCGKNGVCKLYLNEPNAGPFCGCHRNWEVTRLGVRGGCVTG